LNEGQINAGEVADIAKAAFDFVVDHRFSTEALGIGSGDSDGRLARGGNGSGKLLVEQAGEDHDRGVSRLLVGDAQAGDKFTLNTHALERCGEETTSTVNDQDFVPLAGQCSDLAGQRVHNSIIFE